MESDIDKVMEIITQALPHAGVDVIMIGGHAVNAYGVSRATQDVDFMIASTDEAVVRETMRNAGFTNIADHETVMFFNRPHSPLRVDFLKVTHDTIEELLSNAREIDYFDSHRVRIPRLQDLLAMKVFALASGGPKREDKDLFDIVNLILENDVDPTSDFRELCREYGTDDIYARVCARLKELSHD